VSYNVATGNFTAHISTCPGNALTLGPDDGLCVQPAAITTGCGISGVGSVADPLKANVGTWNFPCAELTFGSAISCGSDGKLRGEPKAKTYTAFDTIFRNYANLAVPAGAALVTMDTFDFSHVNPDTCRAMKAVVTYDMDVYINLDPGTSAEFGLNNNAMWFFTNSGTTTIVGNHWQVSEVFDLGGVGPGGTLNHTATVSGARGTAGSVYNQIQVRAFVHWVPNDN
jgi:hypothetical protein